MKLNYPERIPGMPCSVALIYPSIIPLLKRHACSTVNGSLQPSHTRRGYYGGVYQDATTRHNWTPLWIVQFHPGIWEGRWVIHLPHSTITVYIWPSCPQLYSGKSDPPPPYPPSYTSLPHAHPSPYWCVPWDPVPICWAVMQWQLHIIAPKYQKCQIRSGWFLGTQFPPASNPVRSACIASVCVCAHMC